MVKENLAKIQADLAQHARETGRNPENIQLIAVSKTKPLELIREAIAVGQMHFGENRVQEMVEKQEALPNVHWHMIGRLQRNKVKYIAPFVHLIHSVISEKLLREIDKQARKVERIQDVLFQINISNEEQKGGFEEEEAEELLRRMGEYSNVRVLGLMGMAEYTDEEDVLEAQFRRLRKAADRFRMLENPQIKMQELSMGMSGDYPVAVREGSTMVRVGSGIFGQRG